MLTLTFVINIMYLSKNGMIYVFVNVTIACITPTRECHDESPSLSTAIRYSAPYCFLFFVTVLFRLIALYLVAPVGLKADTGIIYAVLSVSALFARCATALFRTSLGCVKICSGISPCY